MTLEQIQALIMSSLEQHEASIREADELHSQNMTQVAEAVKQLTGDDYDKYGLWIVSTVIPHFQSLNAKSVKRDDTWL